MRVGGKGLSLLCVVLFGVNALQANAITQKDSGWAAFGHTFWNGLVRPVPWGRTFWADMNGELLRGDLAWCKNDPAYRFKNTNTGPYNAYVIGNAAVNFPVWSWDSANRGVSVSVGIPVAFEIWMGPFKDTMPVQNTDYHLGFLEPSVLFRFKKPFLGIHNAGLRLSLFRHESTHIGEEMMYYRDEDENDISLKRVNVSSTHQEIRVLINDPDGTRGLNNSLRFGFVFNMFQGSHSGWYKTKDIGYGGTVIEPNKTFEFYLQDQFQTACFGPGLQGIASFELRIRDRYRYAIGPSNRMESPSTHFVPCFNMMLGIRYNNPNFEHSYYSKIGLAFHYYYGINPYGQYRSLLHYQQFGISLILE
jgi:hypothetical protein